MHQCGRVARRKRVGRGGPGKSGEVEWTLPGSSVAFNEAGSRCFFPTGGWVMEFRGGLAGGGRFGGIGRARRAERRVRRARLHLGMERLEERVVLSTWSGHDAVANGNDNWSDAGNWDTLPTAGSDLLFPPGLSGAALTSNDDISLARVLRVADDRGQRVHDRQHSGLHVAALRLDRRVADLGQLDAQPPGRLRLERGDRDGRQRGRRR